MLSLEYVAEKDGVQVRVKNRLMINESQINDLLDSLVAHGYDILETGVTPTRDTWDF